MIASFPVYVAVWLVYLLIKVPTNLLGFLVVPFMWRHRYTLYKNLPFWTRPWSNLEDWCGQPNSYQASLPRWWVLHRIEKGFMGSDFRSFYRYHALRNAGDGLRSFEAFSVNLYDGGLEYWTPFYFKHYEAKQLREADKKFAFYFAAQSLHAGYKLVLVWSKTHHLSLKFGWRISPHHVVEGIGDPKLMALDPGRRVLYEHRGFASSIHLYREG